jgi:hypothetical protein
MPRFFVKQNLPTRVQLPHHKHNQSFDDQSNYVFVSPSAFAKVPAPTSKQRTHSKAKPERKKFRHFTKKQKRISQWQKNLKNFWYRYSNTNTKSTM